MDGSAPVRLGKGNPLALSPDGKQALVVNVNVPMQAILLPTGAGQAKALPRGPLVQIHAAGFMPDGRRIVLVANETGHGSRLYVQDLVSGEPKPISAERVQAVAPGLQTTPDGAFVAAVWGHGVWLYPTAGGEPKEVAGAAPDDQPLRFSRDGRFLYVRLAGQPRIFRVDLAAGKREPWKEITREGGGPAAIVGSIVLTPDGRSYAYLLRDDTSTLYVAEGLH
ncbi:MAG: TolB family protein, partial [Vicinamibacteria bacterium]